jgi:hypothetical protein
MAEVNMGPFVGTPDQIAAFCAALVQAQAAAQAVAKASTNDYHGYKYASAESVIDEARHALSGAGLALLTLCYSFEPRNVENETKGGTEVVRGGIVRMTYRLVHSGGGHVEITDEMPAIPGKGRPVDKAIQVAKTASLAYVLRGITMLPRVEAGTELAGRDDKDYEPPPAQQRQQQPAGADVDVAPILARIEACTTKEALKAVAAELNKSPAIRGHADVVKAYGAKQKALASTNGSTTSEAVHA